MLLQRLRNEEDNRKQEYVSVQYMKCLPLLDETDNGLGCPFLT